MDVYVVLSGWASDGTGGGVVVGAGAGLADAQAIADRYPMPRGWSDWEPDPGPGPQALRWSRRGLGQCRQEIVCVPVAGCADDPPGLAGIEAIRTLGMPPEPALTVERIAEMTRAWRSITSTPDIRSSM